MTDAELKELVYARALELLRDVNNQEPELRNLIAERVALAMHSYAEAIRNGK